MHAAAAEKISFVYNIEVGLSNDSDSGSQIPINPLKSETFTSFLYVKMMPDRPEQKQKYRNRSD